MLRWLARCALKANPNHRNATRGMPHSHCVPGNRMGGDSSSCIVPSFRPLATVPCPPADANPLDALFNVLSCSCVQRGLAFLQRLLPRLRACNCEFLVFLEDDTCVRQRARSPPRTGDIGGLPAPLFDNDFLDYVENVTRLRDVDAELRPAVLPLRRPVPWGCAGACYYRTAAFLKVAPALTPALADAAFEHGAWAVGYMDAIGPALAMLTGLRVVPWAAVGQTHMEGQGFMQRLPVEERDFDHKCSEMRTLRRGGRTSADACPVVAVHATAESSPLRYLQAHDAAGAAPLWSEIPLSAWDHHGDHKRVV